MSTESADSGKDAVIGPKDDQRSEVLMIGPGNAGVDNLLMYMQDRPPSESPSMTLLAVDMDGILIKDRFTLVKPVEPIRPEEKAPEETLKKYERDHARYKDALQKFENASAWKQSGRFFTLQLTKTTEGIPQEEGAPPKQSIRRRTTLYGAGGKVEVGRKSAQAHRNDFKKHLKGKRLLVSIGCGGGGTGTAVMEVTAELAKEMVIDVWSILFTPGSDEGDKLRICNDLRKKLREIGQVSVFHNDRLPADMAQKLRHRASRHYINSQCWIASWVIREYTQVTGTSSNMDDKDRVTSFEAGRDVYLGWHKVDLSTWNRETEVPEDLDPKLIVKKLRSHDFQNTHIEARSILFLFHGPVSDAFVKGVKKETQKTLKCPPTAFIKDQVYESDDELIIAVIVVGTFKGEPAAAPESGAEEVPGPHLVTFDPEMRNDKKKVEYKITVDSKELLALVPLGLKVRWEEAINQVPLNLETLESLRQEFAQYSSPPDVRYPIMVMGEPRFTHIPPALIGEWERANNPFRLDLLTHARSKFDRYGPLPDLPAREKTREPARR